MDGMKGEERLRKMEFFKEILKAAKEKQLIAYQGDSTLTADFLPKTTGVRRQQDDIQNAERKSVHQDLYI